MDSFHSPFFIYNHRFDNDSSHDNHYHHKGNDKSNHCCNHNNQTDNGNHRRKGTNL